jgi:hypothetical protein
LIEKLFTEIKKHRDGKFSFLEKGKRLLIMVMKLFINGTTRFKWTKTFERGTASDGILEGRVIGHPCKVKPLYSAKEIEKSDRTGLSKDIIKFIVHHGNLLLNSGNGHGHGEYSFGLRENKSVFCTVREVLAFIAFLQII